MERNLIPSKKQKTKTVQQDGWNSFWHNEYIQSIFDLFRRYNTFVDLNTLLKKHKHVDTFCELGCGSSILLGEVAKTAKKVIAVDYSKEALNKSNRFFKKNNIKNFKLIEADVRDLNIKEKFDVVHSNGLIEHFEDPGKIIDQHLRITKKNGYTIIAVPYILLFKNMWYLISRISFLSWIWPYPDQIFFSGKSLERDYLNYFSDKNWKYKIKLSLLTENVFLIVKKG